MYSGSHDEVLQQANLLPYKSLEHDSDIRAEA